MATDYNSPLYIGNEMAAFDRKDRAYYDKFTDEERKQFSTYLMLRYGASVDVDLRKNPNLNKEEKRMIEEYYLVQTNERLNKYFFDLNKHPKLQWLLCTTVSPDMGRQNHYWQPAKKKTGSSNKVLKFIEQLYPNLNESEIKMLAEINSVDDLKKVARDLGWDDKRIKEELK